MAPQAGGCRCAIGRGIRKQAIDFIPCLWVDRLQCHVAGIEAFGPDAFGLDQMMGIQQNVVIGDHAAGLAVNAIVVQQVNSADQDFGLAIDQFSAPVVDQYAMLGRNDEVVVIVDRPLGDHDRGKVTLCRDRRFADPADGLQAIVAGGDQIANLERFDAGHARGGSD